MSYEPALKKDMGPETMTTETFFPFSLSDERTRETDDHDRHR